MNMSSGELTGVLIAAALAVLAFGVTRVAVRLSVEVPESVAAVEETCRSVQAAIGFIPKVK